MGIGFHVSARTRSPHARGCLETDKIAPLFLDACPARAGLYRSYVESGRTSSRPAWCGRGRPPRRSVQRSGTGILSRVARIVVVTSQPPFAAGGHLVLAHALVDALTQRGHHATLLLTPQNRFGRQGAAYLSTWLTDVGQTADGNPVDQVISLRYPSYAVRHPRHVCWLNHRMREYYDEWPRFNASLSWRNRLKEDVRRRLIHAADRYLLTRNVTRVAVLSRTIQERLTRWGGIPSEVVYPPPPPRRTGATATATSCWSPRA